MESRDYNYKNYKDTPCNYRDTSCWLASVIIIILITVIALVYTPRRHGISTEAAEFKIESGQTISETARLLAERGLIYSRYLFVGYAILTGKEREFKAGRYLIFGPVSISKLVTIFSSGQSESDDIEVTIPEGTNVADIDKIFSKAGLIKEGDILGYNLKYGSALVQEGFLFPDTYRFSFPADNLVELNSDRLREIIGKMGDNFNAKTKNVFVGRFNGRGGTDRGYRTIIIASILEKEVRTEEDMRLVAGIIKKRLELGMPLEIDATIAYGVCYQQFLAGKYCDVSLANIVDNIPVDSEYNTYKRKGLPVGPISNSGLRAIRAALDPQPSEYLYYLSAKDGTTIFSRTAVEHERARQKYLK